MEIKSRFDHFNFNVLDLDRSICFYEKALGLREVRRMEAADGMIKKRIQRARKNTLT